MLSQAVRCEEGLQERVFKETDSMPQNRIFFFDTTLRDGEQSPGCSMTHQEKLALAHSLADLGVDILEAGFAIASDGDFAATIYKLKCPIAHSSPRCQYTEELSCAAVDVPLTAVPRSRRRSL